MSAIQKIDRKNKNTAKLDSENDAIKQAKQKAVETRSSAKETENLKVEYDNKIIEYKKLQSRIEYFEKNFGEILKFSDVINSDGDSFSVINPDSIDLINHYLFNSYKNGIIYSGTSYTREEILKKIKDSDFSVFKKILPYLEKSDFNRSNGDPQGSLAKYDKAWDLINDLKTVLSKLSSWSGDAQKAILKHLLHPAIKEAAKTFSLDELELSDKIKEIIPVLFQAKKVANEIYQMSHPAITKAIAEDKYKCEGVEESENIKVIANLVGEESKDAPLVITASSDSYFMYMHGSRQCEFINLLKNKKIEAYGKYIASLTKILTDCSMLRVVESNKNYDEQSAVVLSSDKAVSTIVTTKDQSMCDVLDIKMGNMLSNLETIYSYATRADNDIAAKIESIDYKVQFDGEGNPTIGSKNLVSDSVEKQALHKNFQQTLDVFEEAVQTIDGPLQNVTQLLSGVDSNQLMIADDSDASEKSANEDLHFSELAAVVDNVDTSFMGQNSTADGM